MRWRALKKMKSPPPQSLPLQSPPPQSLLPLAGPSVCANRRTGQLKVQSRKPPSVTLTGAYNF